MATKYTIIDTQPHIYQTETREVVNGVLVRFRMDAYNEIGEVRVPKMDVNLVKTEIERVVSNRDDLAGLTTNE